MKATVRVPGRGETGELQIEGITSSVEPDAPAAPARKKPTPEELLAASLASCTATTIELYARRKNWEVGEIEVEVDYAPAQRGSPTRCEVLVRLPEYLLPEQRERLMQVGATSRIHRTLEGEINFNERLELTTGPKAERRDDRPESPRKRIALLNGLRGALRTSQR
jgi:putative redox protein